MSLGIRQFRRALMVASVALAAGLAVVAPSTGGISVAHAEEEAPLRAGSTLVARGDCELQKVTITRGAKVQLASVSAKTADILLPDGYVLKRVSLARVRYFFDVVR